MRRFLGSMLVITAITGPVFGSSQAFGATKAPVASSSVLSKSDMKIGNLYIGENLSRIQKQYGKPNKKTIVHGNGAPRWEYTSRGFAVDGDTIWQIEVSNSTLGRTPRGIHVGSSEQSLRKAYPNLKAALTNQLFEQSNGYSIDFFLKNGVVSEIILTKEKI